MEEEKEEGESEKGGEGERRGGKRRGVMWYSKVKTNSFSHLLFKESPSSGRWLISCSGGRIWYSGREGHLTSTCTPV